MGKVHKLQEAITGKKFKNRDFPGYLMVKTLCFQCRGWEFNPWLGNTDIACHMVWSKYNKNYIYIFLKGQEHLDVVCSRQRPLHQLHDPGGVQGP